MLIWCTNKINFHNSQENKTKNYHLYIEKQNCKYWLATSQVQTFTTIKIIMVMQTWRTGQQFHQSLLLLKKTMKLNHLAAWLRFGNQMLIIQTIILVIHLAFLKKQALRFKLITDHLFKHQMDVLKIGLQTLCL